jgi:hypothetical protein
VGQGEHNMGTVPVLTFQGRPRATVSIVGRSLLGDPRLYKDHFNLISEKRALERDQTFSILSIQLGQDQPLEEAKALTSDTVGTANALYSRGPAHFIAPDAAQIAHYERELEALERKIYRLVGLPWEGDTHQAETADSRRIKATELTRLLTGLADEAERIDYGIARLYFSAMDGPDQGPVHFAATPLHIEYPHEFQAQSALDEIAQLQAVLSAGLGNTANKLARQRSLPILLPDLSDEERATIQSEISTTPITAADASAQFKADLTRITSRESTMLSRQEGA